MAFLDTTDRSPDNQSAKIVSKTAPPDSDRLDAMSNLDGHPTRIARALLVVGLVLLLLGPTVHILFGSSSAGPSSVHALGLDDAYISYRYAKNLTEGNGLVFNPEERVEGFTNPLTVFLAAAWLLGLEPSRAYWLVSFSNLAFLLAGAVVYLSLMRRTLGEMSASLAWLALGACVPLWAWTASGIETIQVLSLQLLAWSLSYRREISFRVLVPVFALCVLVRADGFLIPLALTFCFFQQRRAALGSRCLVTLFSLLLLRFSLSYCYYGDVLPNTYHAKVAGSLFDRIPRGLSQIVELSASTGLGPHLTALAALTACEALAFKTTRRFSFPVIFFVGNVLY